MRKSQLLTALHTLGDLMTQTTIRTYSDDGCPFWDSSHTQIHLIQSLADLIGWTKHFMTDEHQNYIAIYQDDQLIGGWEQETDWEYDYESSSHYCTGIGYSRIQPKSFDWDQLFKHTHRIAFNV